MLRRGVDCKIEGHADKQTRTSVTNAEVPEPCEPEQGGVALHYVFGAEVSDLKRTDVHSCVRRLRVLRIRKEESKGGVRSSGFLCLLISGSYDIIFDTVQILWFYYGI